MTKKLFSLLLPLLCATSVWALEPSSAVKAQTVLKTTQSWDGVPLQFAPGGAEVTGMVIEIAVGGETGWHLHPVPSFGMVSEGELEVRLRDGRTKQLKAGEALAEVVDTLHNGRNVGNVPVKLVVFYVSQPGQALSRKAMP